MVSQTDSRPELIGFTIKIQDESWYGREIILTGKCIDTEGFYFKEVDVIVAA